MNGPLVHAPFRLTNALSRHRSGDVDCPLGVYPHDAKAALSEGFESKVSMGGAYGDDQCEYRVLISAPRCYEFVRRLFEELLPQEAKALYEEFSFDVYRETDTYRSEDTVPKHRILKAWDQFGSYMVEDGKTGFGAAALEDGHPYIEIFMEEHGSVFVACGWGLREQVESIFKEMSLEELPQLQTIDSFEHVHRDILEVIEGATMDDFDIKFSVIESLGMVPCNLDDGQPTQDEPMLFWLSLELDLSFDSKLDDAHSLLAMGIAAHTFEEALAHAHEALRKDLPAALIARVHRFYRLCGDDLSEDINPRDQERLLQPGIWYQSELS